MNYRRKWVEPVPEQDTAIWSCSHEDCNGWMREGFSFEDEEPACPLCSSPMVSDTRLLPVLESSARYIK